MTHDEITTKLELPSEPKNSTVVHVDFTKEADTRRMPRDSMKLPPILEPSRRSRLFPSLSEIAASSPWLLRIALVALVVVLSILVL